MSSSVLLTADALSRSFVDPQGRRQTVLDQVSFSLDRGESVALWGPSGSGKTTLLNLVAGLLQPDSGKIQLQISRSTRSQAAASSDAPLSDAATREDATCESAEVLTITEFDDKSLLRYRREHVGYIFQFFNLIETLTVAENIRLALELAGKDDDFDAYSSRLERLGLLELADRFPAELSGGEQQRVAVLRALAHAPALVLADEPTGNLDRDNSERVADLLWQQVEEQGAALLIATHSDAIARRADRVIEIGVS